MTICNLVMAVLLCGTVAGDPAMPGEMRVPLEKGRGNAPFRYGALRLEPLNLFVQDRPWNDSSPHVQLQ